MGSAQYLQNCLQACDNFATSNFINRTEAGNSVEALATASRLGMPKLRAQCLDDILVAFDKEGDFNKTELHESIGTQDAWKKLDPNDYHILLRAMYRHRLQHRYGRESYLPGNKEARASMYFAYWKADFKAHSVD